MLTNIPSSVFLLISIFKIGSDAASLGSFRPLPIYGEVPLGMSMGQGMGSMFRKRNKNDHPIPNPIDMNPDDMNAWMMGYMAKDEAERAGSDDFFY